MGKDAFISRVRGKGNTPCTKIDRIFVNEKWMTIFPLAEVKFTKPSMLDHSPISMLIKNEISFGHKPFIFHNYWTKHYQFKTIVIQ